MQEANFWNKFYLRWVQVILVLALMLVSTGSMLSQGREEIYNPNYDSRRVFTYGFSIGVHTSAFQLNYSNDFVGDSTTSFFPLDSVHSILAKNSLGFSLGFIVNANVAEFLDLRITPKVGFHEYKLEYNYLNADTRIEIEESTVVELPILAKYKSVRRQNHRMYFIGGITPAWEASSTSDLQENTQLLQVERWNVYGEVGFGLDLYFPLFKFSPELRYSKGLVNVLAGKKNDLSEGIDRLNTSVVALYFHFQ